MESTTAMFQPFETLIHSEIKLAAMSLLVREKKVSFRSMVEKTRASTGTLHQHLSKLRESGYLTIEKSFKDNYPLTTYTVTEAGILAYKNYVAAIKPYLEVN